MTTDNFCFYFQNRLIQTSQAGGQWYSDTSPFSIPCLLNLYENKVTECCNILSASLCFISISDLKMKRARHDDLRQSFGLSVQVLPIRVGNSTASLE